MHTDALERLTGEVSRLRGVYPLGRVAQIDAARLWIRGLCDVAQMGDWVTFQRKDGRTVWAEVSALTDTLVQAIPADNCDGLSLDTAVRFVGPRTLAPHSDWSGRIIDPWGQPLDGGSLLSGTRPVGLRPQPPAAVTRRPVGERLETQVTVLNTLLPLARGQRVGLFAGSGVGKSTLLAALARGVTADRVVIALVGERGRELRSFVDQVLSVIGRERVIIVAATSDRSAIERRQCLPTAVAVADYFRQQGDHVLLLSDSVTRFAEAHREIALAQGESLGGDGFPATLTKRITEVCECAGPGPQGQGDITALFTVLVAGSDMDEPVADILRGVLDGHVILDRKIADRGRYPAVDLLRSVSRTFQEVTSENEQADLREVRRLIGIYEDAEVLIKSGLYEAGQDADTDRAIQLWPLFEQFFTRQGHSIHEDFGALKTILNTRPLR